MFSGVRTARYLLTREHVTPLLGGRYRVPFDRSSMNRVSTRMADPPDLSFTPHRVRTSHHAPGRSHRWAWIRDRVHRFDRGHS